MLQGIERARSWWRQRADTNHARNLRRMWGGPRWCADIVENDGSDFIARGWALAPNGDHSRLEFRINDQPFDRVTYPVHREDVGRRLPFIPDAGESGFECRISGGRLKESPQSDFCLALRDRAAAEGSNSYLNFYFPGDGTDSIPLPDSLRMQRVHGNDKAATFRSVGFSVFKTMENVLQAKFGRGYSGFPRVLDWGCGSGRVTRYFARHPNLRVTGIDIDPDNIGWCREQMPFARFQTTPLHPPTGLPAASFDLLIGISIFTHLKEREHFLWLEELRRLAAPGAVLLMSIHGGIAACFSHLAPNTLRQWRKAGLFDSGACELPGVKLDEADYYRSTYHTPDYVRKHWSKYFKIVDILPDHIGVQQDLVVMRRR